MENVYQWLDDSNLLDGEDEDVTNNYTDNYQGITEAIRIDDITIFEFDDATYAEQFDEIPFALTKGNIGVFVSGFSSEMEGVQEVLQARGPVEGLHKGYYLSAEQQNFVEAFRNQEMTSFQVFTERFYSLDLKTQEDTFHRFLYNEQVEWEGVIVKSGSDLFTSGDTEFVVYGGADYSGEDWEKIQSDHQDSLPFIIEARSIARPFEIEHKKYERGESIKVRGLISEQGSEAENNPWGLRDFLITE
uniref:hypothetical protein n=1 Tax=uncultured Allobacillus sp. TaxID=1638025 RepID=UPI002593C693|nr:hypothetical protein [uncultured Allobacillus sp.]